MDQKGWGPEGLGDQKGCGPEGLEREGLDEKGYEKGRDFSA
jgi:hypothetical protein